MALETLGLGTLKSQVNSVFALPSEELSGPRRDEALAVFESFKQRLNQGEVRAATRTHEGSWRTHSWVKRGILLGFRLGTLEDCSLNDNFRFFDKGTYPLKRLTIDEGVRLVPGGSSVRDGAYLGRGVTIMPPAYVNTGAYVGDGTMLDSHVLVGSCAQVGNRCHISAAAQIGGVLEPIGALPVIIEDEVLVGGNCGVYEGTLIRQRAVLAAGVVITGSTPVYDLVTGVVHRGSKEDPLEIPENAVVVSGTRAVNNPAKPDWSLSIYTPVIIKYRDDKTEKSVQLEGFLR